MNTVSRILTLRGGAIGDFILTLPAIQALRDTWPGAHLEVAGYPHIAELARAGGLADHIASLHAARIARLYVLHGPLDSELAAYLSGFDAIVSFLHDPDGSVARNLEGSGVRRILSVSPINPRIHAADHLLKPVLEWLEQSSIPAVPALSLSDAVLDPGRQWAARHGLPTHTLVLHPGSGSPDKNWPLSRFLELAAKRRQAGFPVVFTLGEADAALAPDVRAFCARHGCPLLENASLTDLASCLAACGALVGNDTGIAHLAAALGLPTLALFGPSDPGLWAPRGPHARILQPPDRRLDSLSLEQVERALDALVEDAKRRNRKDPNP